MTNVLALWYTSAQGFVGAAQVQVDIVHATGHRSCPISMEWSEETIKWDRGVHPLLYLPMQKPEFRTLLLGRGLLRM